ncbi:Uma2 family endonuclease [Tumidithrix elongata RA019]|uniref:Uma2 family endonuclease n=1 Tax=Tumidithrix elongata BACA0141 TaxID=2716417 RepID=A0AAW9PYI9_9CYAN|nr:Uma2 family endonuclease [Tumidithrix elongata RA019]
MVTIPTKNYTPTRHRFTVEQYYKMAEVGILDITQRTELIEGEIIEMSPIGTKHAICVSDISEILTTKTIHFAHVRQQNPVHLSDRSEPQPDIALVKRPSSRYINSHPTPADIFLLIEVSDTTLKYDREIKVPLYAKATIPEVWIANLEAQTLEVYRQSDETGYQDIKQYTKGEVITLESFAEIAIAIDEIFLNAIASP